MPAEADSKPPTGESPPPLRSVHSSNFPALLDDLTISLLITTYQAGKLVIVRSEGGALNTHFRSFNKPMGLAVEGGRLAVGTALEIWEFHDTPAVARRLAPEGKHDACFLPRSALVTGDIQIHEMGWGRPLSPGRGGAGPEGSSFPVSPTPELWFANTRFSCLCTRGANHSFVPRWRPPFITALAPEDRCHLNGLCLVNGQPAFVTALGETDAPAGWRQNKKAGGILIEVATGNILLRGLSMPHSPRWHNGQLWLLESGAGGIGFVDPAALRYLPVAALPGFTRGLDFAGDLAFIGLSQVRETAVFSGIPITERLTERTCGVWVVHVVTGQTVAFLKFEEAVQEIFAVTVLPNLRFPDVINDDAKLIADSFVLPDEALQCVPPSLRFPAR